MTKKTKDFEIMIDPENLSEFKGYKELLKMTKKRSPNSIVFLTNDPEGWFIDCVEYKTKTGKVEHDDLIIEKDMPGWVSWKENNGWKKV